MHDRPPGTDDTPVWLLVVMAVPAVAVLALAVGTPAASLLPNQGDVDLYRRVAAQVLAGGRLYVDISLPYPPLALVPMVVPALAWLPGNPDLEVYKGLFGAWEAGLLVALTWVVRGLARATWARERDSAFRLTVLAVLAIYPLTFRFDLFPTLLAAAGLLAVIENRPATGGLAIGLGVAAKVFPIVYVPVAALRWAAGRPSGFARFGLAAALAVVVVAAPFVLGSWDAAVGQVLGYQSGRGLELESLGSSVALAVSALGGPPATTYSSFSSMNAGGPIADAWLVLDPWLTVGAVVAVGTIAVRRLRFASRAGAGLDPASLLGLASLALLALLLVNKVFSVQYVVWLLPLAALLRWRAFAVAAAAVALSTAIHPFLFDRLIARDPTVIAVLVARNALLIGLAASLAVGLWRPPAGIDG